MVLFDDDDGFLDAKHNASLQWLCFFFAAAAAFGTMLSGQYAGREEVELRTMIRIFITYLEAGIINGQIQGKNGSFHNRTQRKLLDPVCWERVATHTDPQMLNTPSTGSISLIFKHSFASSSTPLSKAPPFAPRARPHGSYRLFAHIFRATLHLLNAPSGSSSSRQPVPRCTRQIMARVRNNKRVGVRQLLQPLIENFISNYR